MGYVAIRTFIDDNVAIAISNIPAGSRVRISEGGDVKTNQEIPFGHKVAISPIAKGSAVIRYGEVICQATADIKDGDWVHTHNTMSEIHPGRDESE